MKTLVVYDSVFGNTEKVALKIGEELGAETIKVSEVSYAQLIGLDCLVVGSPTRAFNPTRARIGFGE
jgi:flavodoxin